jgi:methionine biosynthesis protein MetW
MKLSTYYEKGRYSDESEKWRSEVFFPRRLNLIKSALSKSLSGRVLDIGCGDGTLLQVLKTMFPRVELYGCDISKEGLQRARKRGIHTKIVDVNKGISYKDNSFDAIISHEVIEHVLDPDFFLQESRRVLKKDGMLILTTPNLAAWYNRILFIFGVPPISMELSTKDRTVGLRFMKHLTQNTQPVGHIRVFTKHALLDLLERAEFHSVTVIGDTIDFSSNPLYRLLDASFKFIPSLSSNLIIIARK